MYPELKYLKHQNLGKTMKRLEKFLYQKIRATLSKTNRSSCNMHEMPSLTSPIYVVNCYFSDSVTLSIHFHIHRTHIGNRNGRGVDQRLRIFLLLVFSSWYRSIQLSGYTLCTEQTKLL